MATVPVSLAAHAATTDVCDLFGRAQSLLSDGHVPASAAMFRAALEEWARTALDDRHGDERFWLMTISLACREIVSRRQRTRLVAIYSAASEVVHLKSKDADRLQRHLAEAAAIIGIADSI